MLAPRLTYYELAFYPANCMEDTFYAKLERIWHQQDSLVCVGLDPDMTKLPRALSDVQHPYFEFCRQIIDATAEHVAAFKPQAAHFSAVGAEAELAMVFTYLAANYPQHISILDAKRGDIGTTAEFYAMEAYQRYGADATTVNPYLGKDSIDPYLAYPGKGIIVLCRTSNPASDWIQSKSNGADQRIFEQIASCVVDWNDNGQFMLVTGATYPEELGEIRQLVGNLPLLVPGIGAQGGDLNAVLEHGLDEQQTGLLISSSRAIIYAGSDDDFAAAAALAALDLKKDINKIRNKNR